MNYPKKMHIAASIRGALREDGAGADITSRYALDPRARVNAVLIAKQSGILCGIGVAGEVFRMRDKRTSFRAHLKDGSPIHRGTIVATLNGYARSILSSERVALNFISLLSGIATRTRAFVDRAKPYKVKILDTRKTLPGLRLLEKYAVKTGGGHNHRMSLAAMALIKENHRDACLRADLSQIVQAIKKATASRCRVEIEARNLVEFIDAINANADIILLDNMPVAGIRLAVKIRNRLWRVRGRRILLEASGNMRLSTLKRYASSGVDYISLGTLTKDIQTVDFSLDVKRSVR